MLLFLLACGPKLPDVLQPNASINLKNCNKDQYLVARGIGKSQEESISHGQTQISNQIQSSISSQREMMTEYIGKTRTFNGKIEKNNETIKKFQNYVKVSSSFEHLELKRKRNSAGN